MQEIKKYFKKLGIANAEYTAWMCNGSQWYQSEDLYEEIKPALESSFEVFLP